MRTKGEQAYLTIKGKSARVILVDLKRKKEIPLADADQLLYYVKGIITKTRFEVKVGEHTYEDEFYEENEGLLSLK
jgi:adenylate cyclase